MNRAGSPTSCLATCATVAVEGPLIVDVVELVVGAAIDSFVTAASVGHGG